MNDTEPNRSKKGWMPFRFKINYIIVVLLLILVSLFSAYFLMYVPRQSQLFTARYIRELTKINDQFIGSAETIKKSWINYATNHDAMRNLGTGEEHGPVLIGRYNVTFREDSATNSGGRITGQYPSSQLAFSISPNTLSGRTSLNDVLSAVPNNISFDELIILRSDNTVVYQTLDLPVWISNADSIKFTSNPISNVDIFETNLSGRDFRVFSTEIKNGLFNEPLIVMGLVESSAFYKMTGRVSGMTVLVMLFALVIFFLSIPFIKVFSLSKIETNNTVDILWMGVSYVFSAAFLVLFLINLYTYFGP
ncbi:MAG: hypothetical protein OEY56_03450 [Cyclobacteriaceae bacterium]|nr:hypothetical protein [Cyclobacteriaceae bacterium]